MPLRMKPVIVPNAWPLPLVWVWPARTGLRQLRELAQPQVRDGEKVDRRRKVARGAFGVLHQAVHVFNEGVASMIEYASHSSVEERLQCRAQALESFEPGSLGPGASARETCPDQSRIVVSVGLSEYDVLTHRLPPAVRDLEVGSLQPIHGAGSGQHPTCRVAPHPTHDGAVLLGCELAEFGLDTRTLVLPLRAADLVHGFADQLDDAEPVVTVQRLAVSESTDHTTQGAFKPSAEANSARLR